MKPWIANWKSFIFYFYSLVVANILVIYFIRTHTYRVKLNIFYKMFQHNTLLLYFDDFICMSMKNIKYWFAYTIKVKEIIHVGDVIWLARRKRYSNLHSCKTYSFIFFNHYMCLCAIKYDVHHFTLISSE